MPTWTSSSGNFSLRITHSEAVRAAHVGRCDDDVQSLSTKAHIRRQLEAIDRGAARRELKEYGVWSAKELQDHEENLRRILWLACGDINDERDSA